MSAKRYRLPIDHTQEAEEPILLVKKASTQIPTREVTLQGKINPDTILRCRCCRAIYMPQWKRWMIPPGCFTPRPGLKILEAVCPSCEEKGRDEITATA